MRIILVVAADRHRWIGRDGGLPWRLPSELKHFKAVTLGHPCLMGRRTWASIGRPLPGRDMIVLTRGAAIAHPDVVTVSNLVDALAVSERAAARRGVDALMVIGGGEIYRLTLPLAHRVLYTEVDAALTGDTQFPTLPASEWTEIAAQPCPAQPGDDFSYTIRTFERTTLPPAS